MAEATTEREVKLAASEGFVLPDLTGLAEGVAASALEPRLLDAVYFDTPDLRLARWGVSLRHRTGDGTGWTVKLPESDEGPVLVRREVPFPGAMGIPPEGASDLVRAYVRGASLDPVARLQTRRQGVELRDEEGHRLAEIVADDVTVLEGDRVAARFREVEVEVDDRAPRGLLEEVLGRLRVAGAGAPDPTSKVARALGPQAALPPEVQVPRLGRKPAAGEAVTAALAASVNRILLHDSGVRLGDDPEDVHQARVGARRLRSDLRTFRPLLATKWAESLRDELGWLGSVLGDVRDADVLTDRLRHQATELPEVDAAGFAPVLRRLADEREAARVRLLDAMRSERYIALLDRLVLAAMSPRLTTAADQPARVLLPQLVSQPWTKLRTEARAMPPDPSDDALHQLRIRAKRARYAAEAAAPVVGQPATSLASAIAGVQEVLGQHHDAVVAEGWLREHATGSDAMQALAVGELVAVQRAEAARHRDAWRKAWKKADRKKLRSWLP